MSRLGELVMYGRFLAGLPGFFRRSISVDEARAIVRARMADREHAFLRWVEKGIYGYPRSPYRRLLDRAGCTFGDLANEVRSKGLEPTLQRLHGEGVYVTFEEFKGREPMIRGGEVIRVEPSDFDNPYLKRAYQRETGGSTGTGTRVNTDLDHLYDRAPYMLLGYDAHGSLGIPHGVWRGVLPDSSATNLMLTGSLIGLVPEKWFSPVMPGDIRPALKYRLAQWMILRTARACGMPFPDPEPTSLHEATKVARWMADTLARQGRCRLSVSASMAVRVASAAREAGLDLTGAIFSGGGEPLTPAKERAIRNIGARFQNNYYFTEVGGVGTSCAQPFDENDQHFFHDALGLIQYTRRVPNSDIEVDAFCFTTLLASVPKLLLNVEIDDYGVIEERSCGCPLEEMGWTTHIRGIRSFRKLTGEGVTLVGSEMERILDEVLPGRFGGTPTDYQLLEEEDEAGLTRLSVIVSPRIRLDDEEEVVRVVLDALGKGSVAADLARAYWAQAGTLRVNRVEPVWTARGKLMPLHLVKRVRHPNNETDTGAGKV